jgi:drug/metabolite transporter (DMT)-like permease
MHFFSLNPKRDHASRIATLRRNSLRLLPPLLFAILTTAAWYCCYRLGWYLPHDAEAMLSTAIVVDAALFAIAAALILNGVWERSRNIARYVLKNDKQAFMEVRDEKIPIAMHLVLAVLGLGVLVMLAAAHYSSPAGGGLIMFATAFAMSLYFVVTLELQEPTTSVWFSMRIPEDWLREDVDKYFKEIIEKRHSRSST